MADAGSNRAWGPVRAARFGAVALTASLALTACGGGGSGGAAQEATQTPEVKADPELAAMVPGDIREAGKVSVGVDPSYPPGEFLDTDGKTVIGFNVELFDAVAAKLDLETTWESAPFGNIVTGVSSGKYEVGVSSFTINEKRMEQVNMVSYFTVGSQWFTQKGNPEGISPDEACGKRIAVQKSTIQVPDIEARSEQCVEDGKPKIDIDQYQKQNQATASVASGKNDAGLADLPVAVYAVQQTNGKLETLGEPYEAAPYGALVNKEDDKMAEAVEAGYEAIIEDGTYLKVLKKWGLEKGALEDPTVNPEVEG